MIRFSSDKSKFKVPFYIFLSPTSKKTVMEAQTTSFQAMLSACFFDCCRPPRSVLFFLRQRECMTSCMWHDSIFRSSMFTFRCFFLCVSIFVFLSVFLSPPPSLSLFNDQLKNHATLKHSTPVYVGHLSSPPPPPSPPQSRSETWTHSHHQNTAQF